MKCGPRIGKKYVFDDHRDLQPVCCTCGASGISGATVSFRENGGSSLSHQLGAFGDCVWPLCGTFIKTNRKQMLEEL